MFSAGPGPYKVWGGGESVVVLRRRKYPRAGYFCPISFYKWSRREKKGVRERERKHGKILNFV